LELAPADETSHDIWTLYHYKSDVATLRTVVGTLHLYTLALLPIWYRVPAAVEKDRSPATD